MSGGHMHSPQKIAEIGRLCTVIGSVSKGGSREEIERRGGWDVS